MMNNKRGLSQVVTTVIIILLVLAAIAIIWSFVRPVIESSSRQVSSDCFIIDFDATCDLPTNVTSITRRAGAGDLRDFVFVVGGTIIVPSNAPVSPPGVLATADYNFSGVGVGLQAGDEITISAVVSNELRLCPVRTITCTA